MRLVKVISGGQTGVDVAALRAAKALGIETGGTMPKGFRTHDGDRHEYAKLFGVVDCRERGWAYRTAINVRESDATLRLAYDITSPGERCTLKAVRKWERPHYDVVIFARDLQLGFDLERQSDAIRTAATWLRSPMRGKPSLVLNVAGNSEKKAPGIEAFAEGFLRELFAYCL